MPTVIVYWSPGRTEQQKAAVIENITETLVRDANARKEDVLIIFQNIEAGDAGRAGHVIGTAVSKTEGSALGMDQASGEV